MPARASSPPRWSSSPSVKTWRARSSRDAELEIADFAEDIDRTSLTKQHEGSAQESMRHLIAENRRRTAPTAAVNGYSVRAPQSLHPLRFQPLPPAHPRGDHPGVCPRRSRGGPRHHPGEYQSSRIRADDHRPKFPREDQCQHRQQRRRLQHRGGSREDALVHKMGRRHRDGSLHRERTSTPPANGFCATRPCPSAPCRSIRRSKR